MIKDSGERTQFNTGAVRDMHEGKGRMDLLPLSGLIELSKHCENGAIKYGEHNVDKGIPLHSLCDSAMRHLVKFMRGDKDEDHLVAAAWNMMWALDQRVNHPELNDLPWAKNDTPIPDTEDTTYIETAKKDPNASQYMGWICGGSWCKRADKCAYSIENSHQGTYEHRDLSIEGHGSISTSTPEGTIHYECGDGSVTYPHFVSINEEEK